VRMQEQEQEQGQKSLLAQALGPGGHGDP